MAASWGSTARCISPMIPPTTRSFTSPRGTWVSARSTRRSEEHTSELQSPCNLVCRLLLEKKNKPIVHKHGLGNYAYARARLIQHNLRFEEDWRHANLYFSQARTRPNRQLHQYEYTVTVLVPRSFCVILTSLPVVLCSHATMPDHSSTPSSRVLLRLHGR